MPTTCSPLMEKLYGKKDASNVFNMLEDFDPELNKIVQNVAYDFFWARSGLTISEKSLITVSTLLAMQKEKQARLHIIGFLHTGGSAEEIVAILLELSWMMSVDIGRKGLLVLCDVLQTDGASAEVIQHIKTLFNNNIKKSDDTTVLVCERMLQFAKVSASVVIGESDTTIKAIEDFLKTKDCHEADLRNMLIHQIVYCGFPAVINGFSALKSVIEK